MTNTGTPALNLPLGTPVTVADLWGDGLRTAVVVRDDNSRHYCPNLGVNYGSFLVRWTSGPRVGQTFPVTGLDLVR